MLKSKFFRVAVEGQTTDGRQITREQIVEMASNYDPDVYGARTWIEHLRSYAPVSMFGATGDVLALKTEEITEGTLKGKLALMAQVSPTEYGQFLAEKRDKVYWSIEMDTDFSDTGEAYMYGLAHTDSPASLGTEMMQFSAAATESPLEARKHRAENLFSSAIESDLEFDDDGSDGNENQQGNSDDSSENTGLFSRVTELLSGVSGKAKKDFELLSEKAAAQEQTILLMAGEIQTLTGQLADQSEPAQLAKLNDRLDSFKTEFEELKQTLSIQPASQPRGRADGAGDMQATDC